MTARGWIGVDLDGTLAHYDGWKGIEHIGAPIAPMVARVKGWLEEGVEVRIFTARVSGHRPEDPHPGHHTDEPCAPCREARAVVAAITAWCEKHLGRPLPITNVKDFGMVELWDDRAVQVAPNTGLTILQFEELRERGRL